MGFRATSSGSGRTARVALAQRVGVASLAAGSVLMLVLAARADTVKLRPEYVEKGGSKQYNGQVVTETATEVKIKTSVGGEQTIPVYKIDSISYEGLTPSFLLAESRENSGSLPEAAELYLKAANEAKGKSHLERAALFNRARILADLAVADDSKANEAIEALESFVKAQPVSRQIGPALTTLFQLRLAQGNLDKAQAALSDYKARVKLSPDVAKEVDLAPVFEARLQAKKGDNEAALKTLDAVLESSAKGSPRLREAKLARAESLAALKQYPAAEETVREVIDQAAPEDQATQAIAYNTLGDCLKAAGRPKDALIAYLKTDVLFDGAKDQHARALSQIVELWRTLKQDGRANEVQERLRELYPQSPYARTKAAR